MEVGVGFSLKADAKERAQAAGDMAMGEAQAVRARSALVFMQCETMSDYNKALQAVAEVTGAQQVFGASARGVLTMQGEQEEPNSCAVMVFDYPAQDNLMESFLYRADPSAGLRAGHEYDAGAVEGSIDHPSCVMAMGDPSSFSIGLANDASQRYGAPVFGGGASGFSSQYAGAPVFFRQESFGRSSCLVRFASAWEVALSVSYSCRAFCAAFPVTKVKQQLILELSGKPAAKILEAEVDRFLKRERVKRSGSQRPLPLMAGVLAHKPLSSAPPEANEFYVRPILAIDANTGGIMLGEGIPEGSYITFVLRERIGAHRDLEEHLNLLQEQVGRRRPHFGFYFNCAGRGQELYEQESHDVNLIRRYLGEFPLIGMFSSFELVTQESRIVMNGFTGVLALFLPK